METILNYEIHLITNLLKYLWSRMEMVYSLGKLRNKTGVDVQISVF